MNKKLKYIVIFLNFTLLLSGYSCSAKKVPHQSMQKQEKKYKCCNIIMPPSKDNFLDSLSNYLCVSYSTGGEFGDYDMEIEYAKSNISEHIITSIKFYTKVFLPGGRQKIFRVTDTIKDYLIISHLLDSLKIYNPLSMSCVRGFDEEHTVKGKIDVYFKDKDSSNCFLIYDTNNTLTDPHYLFFVNIFNDRDFFPILLKEIQQRRDRILDSLVTFKKKRK